LSFKLVEPSFQEDPWAMFSVGVFLWPGNRSWGMGPVREAGGTDCETASLHAHQPSRM
jgi:hypothetical protein